MTDTAQIRRRADGSIDTAHYIARGRLERSAAAHSILPEHRATAPRRHGPLVATLATLAVAIGLPWAF